jgi:hypothetical protein
MAWARAVRVVLGGLGMLAILGGLAAVAYGEALAGIWGVIVGVVLLAAAILEKGRYRARGDQPERPAGLQPTNEVFVDPATGDRIRVWFDPNTGSRRYEPDR